jgi:hypothetical protein
MKHTLKCCRFLEKNKLDNFILKEENILLVEKLRHQDIYIEPPVIYAKIIPINMFTELTY